MQQGHGSAPNGKMARINPAHVPITDHDWLAVRVNRTMNSDNVIAIFILRGGPPIIRVDNGSDYFGSGRIGLDQNRKARLPGNHRHTDRL